MVWFEIIKDAKCRAIDRISSENESINYTRNNSKQV